MLPIASGTMPLSPSQYTLWRFTQQLALKPLNIVVPIQLIGALEISALEFALGDVIERHHSLRTLIFDQNGQPVSHLQDGTAIRPALIPIRALPSSIATVVQSCERKFALSEEIPIRPHLLFSSPRLHTLVLAIHPMAIDSWSIRTLLMDLSTAYAFRCKRRVPRWRVPSAQYADYRAWQEELLAKESGIGRGVERHVAISADILPKLPRIPFPRPLDTPTRELQVTLLRLNPGLHRNLLIMAENENASLLMILHSALILAFSRLLGRSDVPIAIVVSGRKTRSHIHIVGPLAKTMIVLPCFDDIGENFSQLLSRVRQTHISSYSNSSIDWSDVFGGGAPTVVMITVTKRNRHEININLPKLRMSVVPQFHFMGGCGLALDFVEFRGADGHPQGIEGQVRCNAELISTSFAPQLIGELTAVLEAAVGFKCSQAEKYTEGLIAGPCTTKFSDMPTGLNLCPGSHLLYMRGQHPTHDRLIRIWEKLLRLGRVGIWDDFFKLGGDLPLLQDMLESVQKLYKQHLPISLFEHGVTVSSLSTELAQRVPSASVISIQHGDLRRHSPFWLLHGDFNGRGLYSWELSQFLDPAQPFYVIPPHGANGHRVPESIEAMARDCVVSIKNIQPHGPYFVGGYCVGGLVALEIVQTLKKQGNDIGALFLIDASYSPRPSTASSSEMNLRSALGVSDGYWRYVTVGRAYRPAFYPGTAILLLSGKSSSPTCDVISRWREVIQNLKIRQIAGDHKTCLTQHIASLGRELRGTFDLANKITPPSITS